MFWRETCQRWCGSACARRGRLSATSSSAARRGGRWRWLDGEEVWAKPPAVNGAGRSNQWQDVRPRLGRIQALSMAEGAALRQPKILVRRADLNVQPGTDGGLENNRPKQSACAGSLARCSRHSSRRLAGNSRGRPGGHGVVRELKSRKWSASNRSRRDSSIPRLGDTAPGRKWLGEWCTRRSSGRAGRYTASRQEATAGFILAGSVRSRARSGTQLARPDIEGNLGVQASGTVGRPDQVGVAKARFWSLPRRWTGLAMFPKKQHAHWAAGMQ